MNGLARNSIFGLWVTALLAACSGSSPELSDEVVRENNRAVGLMGQYENTAAGQIFARLAAAHPEQWTLRSNLAIALLNRQSPGDEQRAFDLATALLIDAPEHLPARYVAGLAALYLGRVDQALPHLLAVADADPRDAHAAYFAAQALTQSGQAEQAIPLYRRALAEDPYLRSAYYALALLLRQQGDAEAARTLLSDYQRLQANPRAHLAEFRYTRMGVKAEAQVLGERAELDPTITRPAGPLFGSLDRLDTLELPANGAQGASLSTADIDGDGRQDLLMSGPGETGLRFWRGTELGFAPAVSLGPVLSNGRAAFWGDLDNDGQLDLVLCGDQGVQWWRTPSALADGSDLAVSGWKNLSEDSGLGDWPGCRDGVLIDADHDGDLDFMAIGDHGNELFSNNLNGTFRRLSEVVPGLAERMRGVRQVLAADVDADRDLDLILLPAEGAPLVWRNDRLWSYEAVELAEGWSRSWLAGSVVDLQANGLPSLLLLDAEGGVWQGDPGSAAPDRVGRISAAAADTQLLTQDFDGDGQVELLVWNEQGVELFAFAGDGQLQLLWRQTLKLHALTPVFRDPAAGPDLLVLADDEGALKLGRWRAGSGRFPFVAIAPTGVAVGADGTRSNASGIGTQLRLRSGRQWSILEALDRDSAPGQSLQPLMIGLGGRSQLDFVELGWSDGVMQTELGLSAGQLHRIEETQRQLASCPVLFAWNGKRFEFVSDLLGVGGIGFLLGPAQYAESRPWEFFRLPEGALKPLDGRYLLKIGEPMEEVAYLDQAKLHVYDLPPGWSMSLDERMHTGGGPAPTGAPLFYRDQDVLPWARLLDQRGMDVSAVLAEADLQALDPGPRDRRFLGRLQQPMELDLLLKQPVDSDAPLLLVADGWVEYPYSQTLFSAWQAGAGFESFSLDAQFADGQWKSIYTQFGYPAGMPREFSLPLPEGLGVQGGGLRGLRLRGNLEVYLDRLRLVQTQPAPADIQTRALAPTRADVRRVGFPRRTTLQSKLPYYDYEQRSPFWDTRYPAGHYTRFGPALDLVSELDDAMAIIGPGDEIELEFTAPAAPPAGWSRVLVLEVRGYAKDMDLYTRDGGTVGPLPLTPAISPAQRRPELAKSRNTRFQEGR